MNGSSSCTTWCGALHRIWQLPAPDRRAQSGRVDIFVINVMIRVEAALEEHMHDHEAQTSRLELWAVSTVVPRAVS